MERKGEVLMDSSARGLRVIVGRKTQGGGRR
jgi:hypothetical protein